jgi:demethylmenaquinone methyltransferase / 2-methoxy-6-polyprenyl-1,4-benzoquinol methylase
MKKIFDSIAHQYDLVNSLASFGLWHRWNKALVQEALQRANPSTRILDVCTGTGEIPFRLCEELLKHTRLYPHIDCLDFSPRMLELAKIKLKDCPCCSFLLTDATSIPCPEDSYDMITISYGLRNLDKEKAVPELFRVLKKGGSLLILELTPPNRLPIRLLHSLYLSTFVMLVGLICTHHLEPYSHLRKSIQKFSMEKVTIALQQAGFTSIIVERFLFGTVSLIKAKKA